MHREGLAGAFQQNLVAQIGFDTAKKEPCKVCPFKVLKSRKLFDNLAVFCILIFCILFVFQCISILTGAKICTQVRLLFGARQLVRAAHDHGLPGGQRGPGRVHLRHPRRGPGVARAAERRGGLICYHTCPVQLRGRFYELLNSITAFSSKFIYF